MTDFLKKLLVVVANLHFDHHHVDGDSSNCLWLLPFADSVYTKIIRCLHSRAQYLKRKLELEARWSNNVRRLDTCVDLADDLRVFKFIVALSDLLLRCAWWNVLLNFLNFLVFFALSGSNEDDNCDFRLKGPPLQLLAFFYFIEEEVALVYYIRLVQVKGFGHLFNPPLTIYDITLESGLFRKILLIEFCCVFVAPAYYCVRAHA